MFSLTYTTVHNCSQVEQKLICKRVHSEPNTERLYVANTKQFALTPGEMGKGFFVDFGYWGRAAQVGIHHNYGSQIFKNWS